MLTHPLVEEEKEAFIPQSRRLWNTENAKVMQ